VSKLLPYRVACAGLSLFILGHGTAAYAAPAAGAKMEEIIVTAQKREQRLQDVPLAISAYGSKELEAQAVQGLSDLSSKAPNVILAPVGAFPYAANFYVRGLGFSDVESSFEPAVGVEMNGVYLARNSGALMDFFDIEAVELLRGPQGTLYGRNTIGGVLSLRTKRPTGKFDGMVQGTLGDRGRVEGRGAVDFPILEGTLSGRVSLLYKDYDGYWYNDTLHREIGDNEVKAGRATFVYDAGGIFDATLIVDKSRERGSGPGMNNASLPSMVLPLLGYPADQGDPYTVHGDTPPLMDLDSKGLSLEANWQLGFATLTSITGYRKFKDHVVTDFDASNIPFFFGDRNQTHEQTSEELRLASKNAGAFDYVVGLFYLDQHYRITNAQGGGLFGGATLAQHASQQNTAYALFGQLDYHLTEQWTLTAGARYSYEDKDFINQPVGYTTSMEYTHHWDDLSPKLGVSYQFSPDLMVYAQWSQGFRSGGYNGRAGTFTSAGPFGAENVDSYETGVKSELADGRLRLNAAAFYSDYKDMQLTVQGLTQANTYESITANAGKATIKGVELDARLLAGDFTFDLAVGYLDAGFDRFFAALTSSGIPTDNSNLPLPFAPDWTASLGVTYAVDTPLGALSLQTSATYTDDMYTSFTPYNAVSDFTVRRANVLVDAAVALTLPDEHWKIALWGKNLTDRELVNNVFSVGPLFAPGVYQPPRTWALDVSYRF